MAILGIITDLGLSTSQLAANNEGFHLVPVSFGVSDQAGTLDPARTTPNAGQFYTAAISSRVIIDQNTIKFVLTIPPNQIPSGTFKIIREIYLNINDNLNQPFLFAIGQPTDEIRYNADDQVTLELEMSITNLDLTANFVFEFTQATEISEHNLDPNAHTEVKEALRKAGIFIPAGAYPFQRRGQAFEDNGGTGVEFDGVKAATIHGGVTFSSTFNGTETNGKQLVFDGVLTADEVRAVFNTVNYPNTVEHDGTGTEVLAVATPTLSGGSYIVQENDIVYKDLDGVYKQALADGTIKSKVAGIAYLEDKCVSTGKYHDINTGFPIGTNLFLSGTTAGALVNFDTNVNMGLSLGSFIVFIGYTGDVSANVSQDFDAVVTNSAGVGQFLTTQEAINFVPNDGRILINKLENVKNTINTLGKNLTMVVNGPEKGWTKFTGLSTQFRIDFDLVPTQGTFRIEWDSQETNDMPFNALDSDVQNEFNLLNGHNGFTVTGNFSTGFTFTSNDLDLYPLPTFVFAGVNEIQRFDFSNTPDDGTITFEHKGDTTLNFPWDDSAADLKIALEALPSISNVNITGEFATQFFQIEFNGSFLEDGVQEQPLMEVIQTDLDLLGVPTDVNGTTIVPIDSSVVQKGIKPASNLFSGTNPITITTVVVQTGEQVGPERLMEIDSTNLAITGLGKIENFVDGFVLDSAVTKLVLEAYFPNTENPIIKLNQIAGIDYDINAQGFAKDIFSQLQITAHPSNSKIAIISGADQILATGITLTQEISSLLMKFEGAQINFATGSIFESDGVTPLGADFTPPVIAPDQWRWFSVNMIPQGVESDVSLKAQVLVLPASTDGATKELAEKAPFGDKPLGMIAIQGALGDKEETQIVTLKDVFGSLKGKALTMYHPAESVAFWFKDETLDTPSIEATTGVAGVDLDTFNSTNTSGLAAKIVVAAPITIDRVHLFLSKIGSPTGSVSIKLLGESLGLPDVGNIIATGVSVLNMSQVPTNFNNPIVIDFGGDIIIPAGNYYLDIDGTNYIFSAGNFLQWNSEAGVAVEIFNRDPAGAVWLSDLGNRTANFDLIHTVKGYPAIALAADREVEITDLIENDLQSVVATKLQTAINNDVRFVASVSTNKVIVENADLGAVTDADMGDTGFFGLILTQGTDTDLTGIESVLNKNIRQLGTGSGAGGGGDASTLLGRLEDLFDETFYTYLTPYIASSNQSDGIESTDGSFSFVSKTFDLDFNEFLISDDLIDQQLLTDLEDVISVKVALVYNQLAVDSNPLIELTRNGSEYTTITMNRTSPDSDTYTGDLIFPAEAVKQNLYEYPFTNNDSDLVLDVTNNQIIVQEFDTTQVDVIEKISLQVTKLGTPTGFIKFNIYTDNTGTPDIIIQQVYVAINSLSLGLNTVEFDLGKIVADTGIKYHIGLETDDEYAATYSAGVDQVSLRSDSSTPTIATSQSFDGTVWNINAGVSLGFLVEGRNLKLQLKVTASETSKIAGFGIYYGLEGELVSRTKSRNVFSFHGTTENLNEFQLTFNADSDFLEVHDVLVGQTYMVPSFELNSTGLIKFVPDFFLGRETVYLVCKQNSGSGFDNSDANGKLLEDNHLGSFDPAIDKSVAGRGIILAQAVNAIKREVTLDEFGFITIL